MADLATVLSIEDCFDLLEIATVDSHNKKILNQRNKPT